MKLFGINFTGNAKQELPEPPVYSRFAPKKTLLAPQPYRIKPNVGYVSGDASPPRPINMRPQAVPQQDDLHCEDGLNIAILHNALPQRFQALRQDVHAKARRAAFELVAAGD
ncbi:MAG: hypothetical protein AAF754_04655 [Pseudomonadota bacterium]